LLKSSIIAAQFTIDSFIMMVSSTAQAIKNIILWQATPAGETTGLLMSCVE
tara:strand:- start:1010 stop:1162 length:153 start_codon:yes stop_codon:yes gene_type:complete